MPAISALAIQVYLHVSGWLIGGWSQLRYLKWLNFVLYGWQDGRGLGDTAAGCALAINLR